MHGSRTTRVPTATEQSAPVSTMRPAVSCPSTKGKVPMEAKVGEGPVLCAKRWRSLPQIPPVVTAIRAQDGPGRSGSGKLGQRGWKRRVSHVEHNGAHDVSVGAASRRVMGNRPGVRCLAMRVSDATPRRGTRARLLAHGGLPRSRGARGGPRCALAPLPETRGVFREPRRARALRGEPVRRGGGVPVPFVGPQSSRHPSRSGGHGRALPPDRRAPSLQGGALGQVRRCRQLRPAAAPRLWQSQPGRAPSRDPLPTAHDLRLLVGRDRGRRPDPHRALRRGQGRSLYAAVHPVRIAGRRRGAMHRSGGEPPGLPDRHPAPRLGLHRARTLTLLHPG